MQPSILNKILKRTEEKTDYFLTLEICQDKVKTAACEIKGGEVEILAIGEKVYDGSWEEATLAADSAISQVEEKFAVETAVSKVILGLPTEYTKEGKIEEAYKAPLKELLKKLSLVPLGFVEVPFAIIHYLQKQEGGPQTLILVRIGQKLTVSLARVGKVTNNITVLRTDNLALDFEKAITSFAEVEVLPSRILLYDGQAEPDLEKLRQDLINHPWLTRASFLHFPKIEIAPQDLDIKSIAYAAALEIAQVVEITEATEIEKPKVQEETPGFGFVKGEDILERPQEMPPPPQFVSPQEAVPPLPPKRVLPKFTFPQFKLPPIQNLIVFLKARVSPVIPYFKTRIGLLIFLVVFLLLIVGSGVVAASWYIPTAQVNLILESQTLQQGLEISLNPKLTAVDEANKEIPGLTLEVEGKGMKKSVTTGKKTVGEAARGEVTIYNQTSNSKTFKKGTILISPNSLKFTLDEEVTATSASKSFETGTTTWGKQNARVTAVAIGPEGNLGVGQEFHFADFPADSYLGRNAVAFSGGTSREISVVGRSDQERLLASASAELREQAKKDLEGKLGSGEKILDKTLVGVVTNKKFDKEVDEEATELGLEISMKFSALGFKENDLLTMLEKAIIPSIPAGFEFRRDEVKMEIVDFQKKKDETFVIKVNFAVSLLPRINEEEIKKNLTGKNLATADNYLRTLGNIAGYEIKFGRTLPFDKSTLPRLSKNIKIETGSRK